MQNESRKTFILHSRAAAYFIQGERNANKNSSFGFNKGGLNHRARRMQSSLLELLNRSR